MMLREELWHLRKEIEYLLCMQRQVARCGYIYFIFKILPLRESMPSTIKSVILSYFIAHFEDLMSDFDGQRIY